MCQKMSFSSKGTEIRAHVGTPPPLLPCPEGQRIPAGPTGTLDCRTALFWMLTSPAGCGVEVVTQGVVPVYGCGHGPWLLASGAPIVLKSTPADAVVSFDMTVLLTMLTSSASTS